MTKQQDLDLIIKKLNTLTGTTMRPYARDNADRLVGNVGVYYLDYGLKGCRLSQVTTESGASADVFKTGYIERDKLEEFIRVYTKGIEAGLKLRFKEEN